MKKPILFGAIVALTFFANADYLLWQIKASDYSTFEKSSQVSMARIGAYDKDGGEYEALDSLSFTTEANQGSDIPIATKNNQVYKIDMSSFEGNSDYSFYVELLNSSGEAIGRTTKFQTYSQLSNYIVDQSISTIPQASVWHGTGSFEAVPEPSSMALLALGAGLVGLRRKLKKGKKAQKEKRA